MSHCSNCGKFCRDSDIFCLNCGNLLTDYANIKLSNLNYENEDELLNQAVERFSKVTGRYSELMDEFSNSVDKYSEDMNKLSDESRSVSYKENVKRMIAVFEGLTDLFDDVLVSLSEVVFEMLALYNIIHKNPIEDLNDDNSYRNMISAFKDLIKSSKESKSGFNAITITYPDEDFDIAKGNLLIRHDRFAIFYVSFIRELNFIKDKYENNNHMSVEDNHNHFCIYCGARIDLGQNFCCECGKPVYREEEPIVKKVPSKYVSKIDELEQEYDIKQKKAKELVGKLFDPNHLAFDRFTTSINKSNNLFDIQVGIARKMAEMDTVENPFVLKELDSKFKTLETFIDKMEDLTNELVIHLSSNKKDNDEINNLFNDMDDLIDSVKDY